MTSFYDVLGVGVDADLSEVRRAYHRKARLLHPDRYATAVGPERQRAEAEMKAVNEAWATLRDPETRRRYDVAVGLVDTDEEDFADQVEDAAPPEAAEPHRPSGAPRVGVAVALVLVIALVAAVMAAVSQSDDQASRWKAGEIAQLRFAAVNAGLTAPQAECFVQAITGRFEPSEPVDEAVQRLVVAACR